MGSDLLDIARRVVAGARAGEEVEAYVARTSETEVKVHDANVESLVVAERAGVGVRVVIDGRQGFAWAGSLDAAVVDEALAEARDNAGFATPDTCVGIATPADAAGRRAVARPLAGGRDRARRPPTRSRSRSRPKRRRAPNDDRVRTVESAEYGDAATETAIATSTGIEAQAARTTCSVAAFALAGEGVDTRTGYGFSAGRSFADLDVDVAAADAAQRAVRLLGAEQPRSQRLPVVLDPLVTRSLRRDHRRVTQRGGGREGPLDVRRALRRADRRHERDARRRSHRSPPRSARRRTTRRACRRAASI